MSVKIWIMSKSSFSNKISKFLLFITIILLVIGAVYYFVFYDEGPRILRSIDQNNQATDDVDEMDDPEPTKDEELLAIIEDHDLTHSGEYGVSVREVTEPQRFADYQAEEQFIAASAYKLFLSYAILDSVEQGDLTLDTDVDGMTTISECIETLLLVSSDDCGRELGNLIGWSSVDDFIHQQGYQDTHLDNYDQFGSLDGDKKTTAKDQTNFMFKLGKNELLDSEDHENLILENLENQVHQERIPAGLPQNIEVANKPGWLYGTIENDTAIIYGEESTYVVSIMTDSATIDDIAELSGLIYEHLNYL